MDYVVSPPIMCSRMDVNMRGEMCENNYEEIDEACAVSGIVAAIMWFIDFWLIFGFCKSSGHVEPDDAEGPNWSARQHREVGGGGDGFVPHEDYYDTLERRKQELYKPSLWTNDPKSQAQEPIPLSVQQNFYGGPISADSLGNSIYDQEQSDMERWSGTPDEATKPIQSPSAMDHNNADAVHHQFDFPTTPPAVALAPPPHPRTKWEYYPGSLIQTDGSPITIQRSASGPIALSVLQGPTQHPPPHTADASPSQHAITKPDEQSYPTTSTPSCIESPPGSSCYVFNSSQQIYLPSFVNMAARIEQKQIYKRTNETAPGLISSMEGYPPRTPSQISLSAPGSPDRDQSHLQTPRNETKQKNQLNSLSLSPFNFNGSYFPTAEPSGPLALDSPKSPQKSFLSNHQLDQNQSPSGPTQQVQGQTVRRPMMTKRQTSKLSVMTLKNNLQHATANSSSNISSENDGVSGKTQPQMSTLRSIYCGDF
ncbi:hypothetical protein BGX26_010295 [Mortierella sp. AD094]|nr:hypothetical protein BGX26_010295 [Mortierella sp. AD094]